MCLTVCACARVCVCMCARACGVCVWVCGCGVCVCVCVCVWVCVYHMDHRLQCRNVKMTAYITGCSNATGITVRQPDCGLGLGLGLGQGYCAVHNSWIMFLAHL